MKKAIISTISAILGIGVVTTSALFLPALVTTEQYHLYDLNYEKKENDNFALTSNRLNGTNLTVIDAIHGNTKINNGNYIVYIGSEGEQGNRNFLYNVSSEHDFESNFNRSLNDSDFGDGLKLLNSADFKSVYESRYGTNASLPKVLTYIDRIDYNDFVAKDKFYAQINEFKKLPTSKDSIEGKNLSDEQIEINKKKKEWAEQNITFDLKPDATYKDWEGKTQYFRSSWQSGKKYSELYSYITKKFAGASGNSKGIIFAYKINKSTGKLEGKIIGSSSSYVTNSSNYLNKYVPTSSFGSDIKDFYSIDRIN